MIFAIIAGVLGLAVGYGVREFYSKQQKDTAETRAKEQLRNAKRQSEEEILEAKNKAVRILEDAKTDEKKRQEKILSLEDRLEKRESNVDRRLDEIEKARKTLEGKADEVREIRKDVEETRAKEMERLEKIAGLTKEQAKQVLLQLTEDENRDFFAKKLAEMERDGREQIESQANKVLAEVVQKYARSHAADVMTSTVQIPSEEVKGKIIGKEGRNIRSLEKLTGVEIIIDETPDSIIVSGFDPIRREVARIAIEKLLEDGRIHPSRIEESVVEAEKEIDKRIREAGEAAAYEAGVTGLHPKLLYILGRLRYRTSYKQNQLLHSLEVSYLSGALAAELGLDEKTARAAGLLHDIGKAVDHEIQGTHVNIGIKILQKFNVPEGVIHAMRSHHEEYPYATAEAYVVTAADALSAARPGARKETVEKYLKRMAELEEIGNSFEGVEKCYAIQAGREFRVFVEPEKVDDLASLKLAKEIATRIQDSMGYPGEIKVVVMRETRAIEYAR